VFELKLPQVQTRDYQDILISADDRKLHHDYSQPDIPTETQSKHKFVIAKMSPSSPMPNQKRKALSSTVFASPKATILRSTE
jgi:hypothetical protein